MRWRTLHKRRKRIRRQVTEDVSVLKRLDLLIEQMLRESYAAMLEDTERWLDRMLRSNEKPLPPSSFTIQDFDKKFHPSNNLNEETSNEQSKPDNLSVFLETRTQWKTTVYPTLIRSANPLYYPTDKVGFDERIRVVTDPPETVSDSDTPDGK